MQKILFICEILNIFKLKIILIIKLQMKNSKKKVTVTFEYRRITLKFSFNKNIMINIPKERNLVHKIPSKYLVMLSV